MAKPIPILDNDLLSFGKNFSQVTAQHMAEIGLTPEQVAELEADYVAFQAALKEHFEMQRSAIGATSKKDAAKERFTAKCRIVARLARGRQLPGQVLCEMGIDAIDPKSPRSAEAPERLVVIPDTSGTNLLRWLPGENKGRTVYMVEVMNANTNGWQFLASTTKRSYRHEEQRPGFQQSYRVRAVRGGKPGTPSFSMTAYPAERIARAA